MTKYTYLSNLTNGCYKCARKYEETSKKLLKTYTENDIRPIALNFNGRTVAPD